MSNTAQMIKMLGNRNLAGGSVLLPCRSASPHR